MAIYTLKHGVATFTTGAATKSVNLAPTPGNFTINNLQANMTAAIPVMNRGVFLERVEGAEEAVTGTITVLHDGALTDGVTSKVLDAVLGTGNYSGETSDDPGAVVWSGIIKLTSTRDGAVQTHTLANARLKAGYTENEANNEITLEFEAWGNGSGDAYSVTSA